MKLIVSQNRSPVEYTLGRLRHTLFTRGVIPLEQLRLRARKIEDVNDLLYTVLRHQFYGETRVDGFSKEYADFTPSAWPSVLTDAVKYATALLTLRRREDNRLGVYLFVNEFFTDLYGGLHDAATLPGRPLIPLSVLSVYTKNNLSRYIKDNRFVSFSGYNQPMLAAAGTLYDLLCRYGFRLDKLEPEQVDWFARLASIYPGLDMRKPDYDERISLSSGGNIRMYDAKDIPAGERVYLEPVYAIARNNLFHLYPMSKIGSDSPYFRFIHLLRSASGLDASELFAVCYPVPVDVDLTANRIQLLIPVAGIEVYDTVCDSDILSLSRLRLEHIDSSTVSENICISHGARLGNRFVKNYGLAELIDPNWLLVTIAYDPSERDALAIDVDIVDPDDPVLNYDRQYQSSKCHYDLSPSVLQTAADRAGKHRGYADVWSHWSAARAFSYHAKHSVILKDGHSVLYELTEHESVTLAAFNAAALTFATGFSIEDGITFAVMPSGCRLYCRSWLLDMPTNENGATPYLARPEFLNRLLQKLMNRFRRNFVGRDELRALRLVITAIGDPVPSPTSEKPIWYGTFVDIVDRVTAIDYALA